MAVGIAMVRPIAFWLVSCAAASAAPQNVSAALGAATPPQTADTAWPLGKVAFSFFPMAGSDRRKTIETEVVRGRVWTHEQIQGLFNVHVPVRQTVIKLGDGDDAYLWVHNPVAPTGEALRMMRALEASHGPVRHIVLGTLGLEHKAMAGSFSRKFQDATVWILPGQWMFPITLPPNFVGLGDGFVRARYLRPYSEGAVGDWEDEPPVWANEIEYELLGPLKFRTIGAFGEGAFFHKASRTLLVTDTIVKVTAEPPAVVAEDPRALLFHARDHISEEVRNTEEVRRKGWRRMNLFGLVFYPSSVENR